ncbi:hypothetical protein HRR83_003447 [Exophiala dermatitidis]|uniref:Uncharacterized protein n=1 Tax=Exophiala dermatitidis TaxID=5970 RepID=A0AAN6EY87_EXODE|nr:hypothetical protein HRR74_004392 [Exophiala dermatitidis]KAJ4520995.1 hypothetical protein HRR73_003336 [Exophiala dermatitidis]KAJ4547576.1 hypothetical protein HRR76_000210 [Exophiala dermatitidis]KAJ4553516.1 hypothetical protein HRR77_001902 [Exophiala dermatitidis]KAJ4563385.1 hypothetical protein HRR79_006269 [Exophiala dermatitidis]
MAPAYSVVALKAQLSRPVQERLEGLQAVHADRGHDVVRWQTTGQSSGQLQVQSRAIAKFRWPRMEGKSRYSGMLRWVGNNGTWPSTSRKGYETGHVNCGLLDGNIFDTKGHLASH